MFHLKELFKRHPNLKSFLFIALMLTLYAAIGCLLLRGNTNGTEQGTRLLVRQMCSLSISVLGAATVFALPLTWLRRAWAIGGTCVYLALWGLFVFGARLNGSCGWYKFGNFCVQPAELAKPFFIVTLALLCCRLKTIRKSTLRFPLLLAFAGLIILPIALQPDLGTAMILALTFFCVVWCDGLKTKHVLILAALGMLFAGSAYLRYPHLRRRVKTYVQNVIHPSTTQGYHAQKLQECLIKGGWTGNLLHQQDALQPLPYRYSDSMFAGTMELVGALGVIPIVLLCLAWFFYAYKMAIHTTSHLVRLVSMGTGVIITAQALLHISVNLGLFPNTGIPLPLLSYGGSSLLSTFIMVAVAHRLYTDEKQRHNTQDDTKTHSN